MIKEDNLEFLFSGLKSAFYQSPHHKCRAKGRELVQGRPVSIFPSSSHGYSYGQNQESLRKIKFPLVKTLVVAGGVAANKGLRERLAAEITDVIGHHPTPAPLWR